MSGEEDAAREIFGYTAHLPVPQWQDSKAYATCHHCHTKFSSIKDSSKQHHCRLCGHMYCGSCTAKYYLPLVYEQKGKKGPTRVCITCRDSCLAQKEKEKNVALAQAPTKHAVLSSQDLKTGGGVGSGAPRPSQFVGGAQPIEIAPPEWEDAEKYVECAKCHKKGGKPHNCRTCGKLFCDGGACTSKMIIPAYFEKKKKVGPARVCGECRFKILGGAKLVEHLSTDLPALDGSRGNGGGGGGARGSTISTTVCVKPGCGAPRVSKNGFCATHINESGAIDSDSLAASASITLRWEGESAILLRIALVDREGGMTLEAIDAALKKSLPEFAQRSDWEFLYRNEGVAEVFYDIFTALAFRDQGNQIYLRKKVDSDLLVAAYARQGVRGRATAAPSGRDSRSSYHPAPYAVGADGLPVAGGGHAPASGAPLNPFKRRHEEQKKAKAAAPPPKQEAPKKQFRKPTGLKPAGAAAGGGVKKGPPPPPSAASSSSSKPPPPPLPKGMGAAAAPAAVAVAATPDEFRSRAKKYFGAV